MYKHIWTDPKTQVRHIVAMWRDLNPFTACGRFNLMSGPPISIAPGVATCVACWAREFVEWAIEARQNGT